MLKEGAGEILYVMVHVCLSIFAPFVVRWNGCESGIRDIFSGLLVRVLGVEPPNAIGAGLEGLEHAEVDKSRKIE